MQFTVERSRWLRGLGAFKSGLLRDGLQCCMGFVAEQIGVPCELRADSAGVASKPVRDLIEEALPDFVHRDRLGFLDERTWVRAAYGVNDNPDLADADREARLTQLFADNGHELVFVD